MQFSLQGRTLPVCAQRSPRGGHAVLRVSVLAVLLAATLILGLDLVRVFYERQRVQAAAEAGVVGAVQKLRRAHGDLYNEVQTTAKRDIALHGFTDSNAAIEVHMPPVSGEHAGDENYVEVCVTELAPTYFMHVFGPAVATVKARAVSGLMASGDPCIIALDPDNAGALQLSGDLTLIAGCGIMVNSKSAIAMRGTGGACINASWVGVAGGSSGDCIQPSPSTGVKALIDPLLTLPAPDYSSMPSGYTTSAFSTGDGGAVQHYWPGYYSEGVQIESGTVIFEPGIYVLEKGLKITGGNVTGFEVSFYNINSDGERFIKVGEEAVFRMTAPSSGPYRGMLFFNSRKAPDNGPGNRIVRGNQDSYLMGALYFPSQHLEWAGNPENHIYWTMVIANTIHISGSAGVMALQMPAQEQAPRAYRAVLWE